MFKEFFWKKEFDKNNTDVLKKFGIVSNVENDEDLVEDSDEEEIIEEDDEENETELDDDFDENLLNEEDDFEDDDFEDEEDDDFISLDEFDFDDEESTEKYKTPSMKKNEVVPKIANKAIPSDDKLTLLLINEFKKQFQNHPSDSDDKIVENVAQMIIAAFRIAKNEIIKNSSSKKLFNNLNNFENYKEQNDQVSEVEYVPDEFFIEDPIKETQQQTVISDKNQEDQKFIIEFIGNLMTDYMKQRNILQYFVQPVDKVKFYTDLAEINCQIILSTITYLYKHDKNQAITYVDLLKKTVERLQKLVSKDKKIKQLLKIVAAWRSKNYFRYVDITIRCFIDSPKAQQFLSSYKLRVLSEEFGNNMISMLNAIIM